MTKPKSGDEFAHFFHPKKSGNKGVEFIDKNGLKIEEKCLAKTSMWVGQLKFQNLRAVTSLPNFFHSKKVVTKESNFDRKNRSKMIKNQNNRPAITF